MKEHMTEGQLRDYFAAAALSACEVTVEGDMGAGIFLYSGSTLAQRCYEIADAMLKERLKWNI